MGLGDIKKIEADKLGYRLVRKTEEDGLCKHTTHIEHAINFKEIGDGKYIEKERHFGMGG